jgi:hypothetical protein
MKSIHSSFEGIDGRNHRVWILLLITPFGVIEKHSHRISVWSKNSEDFRVIVGFVALPIHISLFRMTNAELRRLAVSKNQKLSSGE